MHSTAGSRYVETAATDSEFVTSGCQPWVVMGGPDDQRHIGVEPPSPGPGTIGAPVNSHDVSGDGDYLVGDATGGYWLGGGDATWGAYGIAGTNCKWERVSDWTGTGVIASGTGPDGFSIIPNTITVHHDDFGFRVSGCGGPVGAPVSNMYWYGLPTGA